MIETKALVLGYKKAKKKKNLSTPLNLQLKKGELTALIGRNGSGKSTLIRTLMGLQNPLSGQVLIDNKKLSTLSIKQIASYISIVLNDVIHIDHLSVYDLVTMGRYPYTGWFGKLRKIDKEKIKQSLELTGTLTFSKKYIGELSDGERQKVVIARAIAQDTPLIFLDEPTAHLDISARVEMISLLKNLTLQMQKSILLATHQLDLALRITDKLWLMKKNGSILCSTPEDLVLNGQLTQVFTTKHIDFDLLTGTFKMRSSIKGKEIQLKGEPILCYWLGNALRRNGFCIAKNEKLPCIEAFWKKESPIYKYIFKNHVEIFPSIERFLDKISHLTV